MKVYLLQWCYFNQAPSLEGIYATAKLATEAGQRAARREGMKICGPGVWGHGEDTLFVSEYPVIR